MNVEHPANLAFHPPLSQPADEYNSRSLDKLQASLARQSNSMAYSGIASVVGSDIPRYLPQQPRRPSYSSLANAVSLPLAQTRSPRSSISSISGYSSTAPTSLTNIESPLSDSSYESLPEPASPVIHYVPSSTMVYREPTYGSEYHFLMHGMVPDSAPTMWHDETKPQHHVRLSFLSEFGPLLTLSHCSPSIILSKATIRSLERCSPRDPRTMAVPSLALYHRRRSSLLMLSRKQRLTLHCHDRSPWSTTLP